ncbi:hypothetical protein Tco_0776755 [Tanacetum coccineum]
MASESASTTTGAGSTSALTIREIIPTNRTPEVWKDFNMCIMTNGQKKAQCKYCFHFLSEGSNTTLKNHITHPHCEVLKAQQNQNPEAGQTSMGRDGQIFMYNPDYLREQFAGLVIQRGLPFNHFDHEQTTRVFQNTMQPRYTHGVDNRRTRLTPESLEMCMCLKDHLDAQERKQDTSPLELPLDVEEGVFNVEVQHKLSSLTYDQEIALDASSDGSSGEPRHDYMMSSGAEDDQTGDGHDGSTSHGYY